MSSFTQCDARAGARFVLIVVFYCCACLCGSLPWMGKVVVNRCLGRAPTQREVIAFWIGLVMGILFLGSAITLIAVCHFPLRLLCEYDLKDCYGHGCTTFEGGACVCRCDPGHFSDNCSIPEHCNTPVEEYITSAYMWHQCAMLSDWQQLSQQYNDEGLNCGIDPMTGVLECEYDTACDGGHPYIRSVYEVTVHRSMTYHCLTECSQGSLLMGCCETCQQAQNKAADGQFFIADKLISEVNCPGCSDLLRNADSVDCHFTNGEFVCESQGSCRTSEESYTEIVEEEDFECQIYPCHACLGEERGSQLVAQCCAECLALLCNPTPNRRIACDGCDSTQLSDATPAKEVCDAELIEAWD